MIHAKSDRFFSFIFLLLKLVFRIMLCITLVTLNFPLAQTGLGH